MLDGIRVILCDWGGTLVRVSRQTEALQDCVAQAPAILDRAAIERPAGADEALRERFLAALAEPDSGPDLREFSTTGVLREWAAERRISLPDGDVLERTVNRLWEPWIGCLDVLGQAAETLAQLSGRGHVIGLASNCAAPAAICHRELARLGIAPRLSFAVISSEVGHRKPHRRMYEAAFEQARRLVADISERNVLFVGDTPVPDIDGPAEFGFATALVRTGRWDGTAVMLNHPPDVVLDSVDHLPEVVGRTPSPTLCLPQRMGHSAVEFNARLVETKQRESRGTGIGRSAKAPGTRSGYQLRASS